MSSNNNASWADPIVWLVIASIILFFVIVYLLSRYVSTFAAGVFAVACAWYFLHQEMKEKEKEEKEDEENEKLQKLFW